MPDGTYVGELIKQFESQTKFYQSMHLCSGKTTTRDIDQQATTLGGQVGANGYANQVFPAKIGLAKRPQNVIGHIGLLNATPFIPLSRGEGKLGPKRGS